MNAVIIVILFCVAIRILIEFSDVGAEEAKYKRDAKLAKKNLKKARKAYAHRNSQSVAESRGKLKHTNDFSATGDSRTLATSTYGFEKNPYSIGSTGFNSSEVSAGIRKLNRNGI
ncbi:MAG: hypothetical protein R3A13_04280 [Bdellovibrionota bacterium]